MPVISIADCHLTSTEEAELKRGLAVAKNATVNGQDGVLVVPPFPHYSDPKQNHLPFFRPGMSLSATPDLSGHLRF